MKLDCKVDEAPSSSRCGRGPEQACCQFQDVLNHIQQDGTLYVLQHPTNKSECDKREEIQVDVTKSFTLKTLPPEGSPGLKSTDIGHIQGVQIMFSSYCSKACSLTISESQFSCSSIKINDLNFRIKDTKFKDSFITVKVQSGNHGNGFNMNIHDSEFKNSIPVKNDTLKISLNNGPCKQLNYVCVTGYWDSVEISQSYFEGNRQSQVSGLEVMHGNIQTLNFVNDQISILFSALVIHSSRVAILNVSDCIFVGNRDGIDIGDGVRYVVVSRSEMNNTGSRSSDDEQCSSTLRGSVQGFKIEGSVFAHNRASGKDCKGAALYLSSYVHDVPLLELYKDHNSTGALTVHGTTFFIQIVASTFLGNEAGKGAGLYLGMSDKWLMGYSQDIYAAHGKLSQIIIDTCIFNENIAWFGGGLMTEFTGSKLTKDSTLSTLINNTSFNRNTAYINGGGACLQYSNMLIELGASVKIIISNTDFNENINPSNQDYGAAIAVRCLSVSLIYSASVATVVNNCSFTSNKAEYGAGLTTWVESCSLDSNSSIMLQATDSHFMANTAGQDAGGIYTVVESCSVHSNSSIISQTSGSIFSSNIVRALGAGICQWVESCSIDSNSFVILQTTASIFTFNEADGSGAGILTVVDSCSVHSSSSFLLQTTNSTFSFNKARNNGVIVLWMDDSSVDSESSVIAQSIDSIFTSNTARQGSGICARVISCSVDLNSSIILQTIDSIFTFNKAKDDGPGIYIWMYACYVQPSSSFKIEATGCSFISGRASRGAGLFLQHRQFQHNGCVSGEVSVTITGCKFLNNSSSWEGGSLYFSVYLITQIHIKHSLFKANKAQTGSGLYRENIDFKTCDKSCHIPTLGLKPQELITFHISQCQFIANIDTAIHVRSKQKYGILEITKCVFKNNNCIDSSFAEDIFTELDLELKHTTFYI